MTILMVSSLAIAAILTAIESLVISLNKWRGLVSFLLAIPVCFLMDCRLRFVPVYSLAITFLSLTMSLLVEQTFTGVSVREFRGLPERIDRM
jgi:hypothetical protein